MKETMVGWNANVVSGIDFESLYRLLDTENDQQDQCTQSQNRPWKAPLLSLVLPCHMITLTSVSNVVIYSWIPGARQPSRHPQNNSSKMATEESRPFHYTTKMWRPSATIRSRNSGIGLDGAAHTKRQTVLQRILMERQ